MSFISQMSCVKSSSSDYEQGHACLQEFFEEQAIIYNLFGLITVETCQKFNGNALQTCDVVLQYSAARHSIR